MLATLATTISACASKPELAPIGPVTDKFSTEILADGTKLFEYRIDIAQHKHSSKAQSPWQLANAPVQVSQHRGNRRQADKPSQLELHMLNNVEQRLQQTGYCAKDYYELSRLVMHDHAEFRGECYDGATAADKEKFANNDND